MEEQISEADRIVNNEKQTIDLVALAKSIWNKRVRIVIITAVFALFGLFIALFSTKEYMTHTVMVPQFNTTSSRLGGLSGLASMAGLNLSALGESTAELSPLVYPNIMNSAPFQKEIMHFPMKWKDVDHPVSLYAYYHEYYKPSVIGLIKKYTIGLPFIILDKLKGETKKQGHETGSSEAAGIFYLTKKEKEIQERLQALLSIEFKEHEGLVVIKARSHDPEVCARLALKAQMMLQEKVTAFRIDKAQQNLLFVTERYNEKKQEFELTQKELAKFRDRNLNMSSAMAMTEEERLRSQYQIAQTVFTELANQLESAKIQVTEDTPVFSVIQPVTVPLDAEKPRKMLIIAVFVVLGIMAGIAWVFVKIFWPGLKKKWNQENEMS
jgi:uncharacterized protein involved in exopolysaccharide biosynthesis